MIKVLPSSNPCPEDNLLEYAKSLSSLGIEYLHCDVMDGNFVENKCLDFETLKNVRNNSNILLDVHLMTENTFENVKKYAEIKPNIITFHYESPKSYKEIKKIIAFLKSKDILVGVSIKPNTPIDMIESLIEDIDLLLIMSVEPGKSGQKFIQESIDKIKKAKELIKGKDIILEVDGGINLVNFKEVIEAGAEFLVMGSAFYNEKNKSMLLKAIDNHY